MVTYEYAQLVSSLATPLIILAGVLVIFRIMWRQSLMQRQEIVQQHALQREILFSQSKDNNPTVDHSGYILLNMPDGQKPIFLDLLKGFEEFAKIKGYEIAFAYDGSLPNKVAFRFTIQEGGISVSTDRVKQDLQEYVTRVQTGVPFDDMPVVISPEEHHTTLLILKNRLNFIQSTYTAQNNVLRLYENVIRDFNSFPRNQTPHIYISNGSPMNPTSYSSVNSNQVAQGADIKMIGNSNSQSIRIGESFEERKALIEKVEAVWMALLKTRAGDRDKSADDTIRLMEKLKMELAEEANPDPGRIKKYIEKAKDVFATGSLAKDAVDAFGDLLKAFSLS